jgi:arylsulfatase A-like enzyme
MKSFRRNWEEGEIRAILDGEHKLIDRSVGQDEFFKLRTDPFEMQNELPDAEETLELGRLRDELAEILERRVADASDEEPLLTDEQVEELRSLGYL